MSSADTGIRVNSKARDAFMAVKPVNISGSDFVNLLLAIWKREEELMKVESQRTQERLNAGLHPVISVPGDPDFIPIEGEDLSKVDSSTLREIWARFEYLLTKRPAGMKASGRPKGAKDLKPRKRRAKAELAKENRSPLNCDK